MSLLIKNGHIITASENYHADIFIEGEEISSIGKNLDQSADEVIDASGLMIFQGVLILMYILICRLWEHTAATIMKPVR